MRYSRSVRIILGILCLALLFWVTDRWYNNSVMSYDIVNGVIKKDSGEEPTDISDSGEKPASAGGRAGSFCCRCRTGRRGKT